jgi:glycosyltransferase involved in cell wall biosynthesis
VNLLFVNHNGFSSNSAVHVTNLANALVELGAHVAVAVPKSQDERPIDAAAFTPVTYERAAQFRFENGRGADLIHAWTPRQHVAGITRRLSAAHGCGYMVHLEDNEHVLAAAFLRISVEDLQARSADPTFDVPKYLAHPLDMRNFLERALGVTAIVERLLEFKPSGLPGLEIWPAAEDSLFRPQEPDRALRASLEIPEEAKILVYHGNAHLANAAEIRSLYLALGALARIGVNVFLIRLGTDYTTVLDKDLLEIEQRVVKVPFQSRKDIPRYLALADAFVQPGRVDNFNSYRFPSKLPEFFAMGRPVILPAANIGLKVIPGEEALVLGRGDAIEIAEAVQRVLSEADLSVKLSAGARGFYERMLNWQKSARRLWDFYERVLGEPKLDDPKDDGVLRRIAKYAGFRPSGSKLA